MTSEEQWYATPIPPSKLDVLKRLKLAFNNDGYFDWGDPDTDGPDRLRSVVDRYAEVESAFFSFGVGRETARGYRSRFLERFGLGIPAEEGNEFSRRMRDLNARYVEHGIDPLAIVTEHAHRRGLTVLANFRVNRFSMDSRQAGSFFRQHPELVLPRDAHPGEYRMNWARPEVRHHHVSVYSDLLEHYDVDGLDLEFCRAIPFFNRDEPDKTRHINEFLRSLREEVDRIGARRGRHLQIAVQFFTPEGCKLARPFLDPEPLQHGLDPAAWAREGLVDMLMPDVWAGRLQRPVDLAPYLNMVEGTGCKLYAWVQPHGVKSFRECFVDVPTLLELAGKCSGIYIFNGNPATVAALVE